MEALEEFEVGDLRVRIVPDYEQGSGDPRDGDNLAVLFCWHPNYVLGDEQFRTPDDVGGSRSMAEIAEWLKRERKAINLIPLFLYDHSGISMSCGETIPDDEPATDEQTTVERGSFASRTATGGYTWDTSMIGFAYTTQKQMDLLGVERKQIEVEASETGWLRGTSKVIVDNVDHQIRAEIKEYDAYLRGEVYGYVIERPHRLTDPTCTDDDCPHDEHMGSCWGFVGDIKYVIEEAKAEAEALNTAEPLRP